MGKKSAGKTLLIEGLEGLHGFKYSKTEEKKYVKFADECNHAEWFEVMGIDLGKENVERAFETVKKLSEDGLSAVIYCISATTGRIEEIEKELIRKIADGFVEFAPFYPRIGICLTARRDLEQVRYFGYGPMEAYADKRLAARLGDFTTTVQDNFESYLRPQENGAHADTSWLSLWNAAGHGLLVTAEDKPFTFGVSHYGTKQLRSTPYRHLLTAEDATYIHLDAAQSGCGSNSCGPALAEEYRVGAGSHTLKLRITPAQNGDIDF